MDNSDRIRMTSAKMDRMSALPDELVVHILSFLKTKQAVQTCMISKRWKYLWTTVSNIDIDQKDFDSRENFDGFVDLVLSRHKAPYLHTFSIRYPDGHPGNRYCNPYRRWICSAMKLRPRVCFIEIYACDYDNFADCAFLCESIEDMSLAIYKSRWLKDCLNIVPNTVHLPHIRRLYLTQTYLSEEIVTKLLTGCPVLEDLTLNKCSGVFSSIFFSKKLVSLSVISCHKKYCKQLVLSETLPKIVGLSCIRRIHITKASLDEDGITRLLIGSPLLEHFSLEDCVGEFSILFRQRLKYLSIRDCIMKASQKNIWWEINSAIVKFNPSKGTAKSKGLIVCTLYPSLLKFTSDPPTGTSLWFENNFDPSIIFSSAESLVLCFRNFKIDLKKEWQKMAGFNNLKSLSMVLADWFMYEINLIVWFLRNSPNAEEITLYRPTREPVSTGPTGKPEDLFFVHESAYYTNSLIKLSEFNNLKKIEIKLCKNIFCDRTFKKAFLGEIGELVNVKIVLSETEDSMPGFAMP